MPQTVKTIPAGTTDLGALLVSSPPNIKWVPPDSTTAYTLYTTAILTAANLSLVGNGNPLTFVRGTNPAISGSTGIDARKAANFELAGWTISTATTSIQLMMPGPNNFIHDCTTVTVMEQFAVADVKGSGTVFQRLVGQAKTGARYIYVYGADDIVIDHCNLLSSQGEDVLRATPDTNGRVGSNLTITNNTIVQISPLQKSTISLREINGAYIAGNHLTGWVRLGEDENVRTTALNVTIVSNIFEPEPTNALKSILPQIGFFAATGTVSKNIFRVTPLDQPITIGDCPVSELYEVDSNCIEPLGATHKNLVFSLCPGYPTGTNTTVNNCTLPPPPPPPDKKPPPVKPKPPPPPPPPQAYKLVADNTLQLYNDCEPCCNCDDFVRTYRGIWRLFNRYTDIGQNIEAARDQLQANIDRWNRQKACRQAAPLRVALAAEPQCGLFVGGVHCNMTACCVTPVVLRVTYETFRDGVPTSMALAFVNKCNENKRSGADTGYDEVAYTPAGTYPVFDTTFDHADPQGTSRFRNRAAFTGCQDVDTVRVTLSVHMPQSYRPDSGEPCPMPDPATIVVPSSIQLLWAAHPPKYPIRAITSKTIPISSTAGCRSCT